MKQKQLHRIFSLLLALVLVLTCTPPVQIFAEEVTTVYLDPANGADAAPGTQTAPVKTLEAAYGKLTAGGTIVLLSDLTYTASKVFPACDYPVTITSATGKEGFVTSGNLQIGGDTTFENITFTLTKESSAVYVSAEGHNLTLGEGITNVAGAGYHFCITAGGRYSKKTANPTVTVKSGTWRSLYAVHGYNVTGNITLNLEGGELRYVAAGYNGQVIGNVTMNIKNTKISSMSSNNSHTDGMVDGNVVINLGDGADIGYISKSTGTVTGTTTFNVLGDCPMIESITGGNTLHLISGTFASAVLEMGTVAVDIPEGKTLTLAGPVTANTVKSAGTLCFAPGGSLTAKAVTGTVSCAFAGEVTANKALVTAPATADFQFPADSGVQNIDGTWMLLDKDSFKGLIIKAESDVTMVFYKDHDREAADKIQPDFTETADGYTYYYFAGVTGYYCYDAKRTGDYTIYQRVYVTQEECDAGYVEEVVMEKKANPSKAEWDHTYYYGQVDEFIEKSEEDMTEKWHTEVEFVTPVFTNPDKPAHQMTTQPEMEAFLKGLDGENDNMYIFSIGKSGTHGLDIPIVFFTKSDLSGCTTLEQVAAKLAADGLPNVGYKAQMHGDEHAAGEGALNVIYQLDKAENEYLLDTINIYVMPRINPDGAYECRRNLRTASMLYPGFDGNTDPNRHNLTLAYHEVRLYLRTVQLFDPIAELDGHERQRSSNVADNQISTSWRYGSSTDMLDLQVELVQSLFTALADVDLSGAWYTDRVNCVPGNNTRSYASAQSRIHLLMETRGIYLGNECYGSRTASHIVTAMAYLKFCASHVEEMVEITNAQRQTLVQNGKTYEETDTIILNSTEEAHPEYNQITEKFNFANGKISTDFVQEAVLMAPTATRVAPTAYVIPKGLAREAEILELLELQEIAYYELPANTAISLQQYSGTVGADNVTTDCTLSTEQMFSFPAGCYVAQMDQVNSYVLALLMEPDNAAFDLVEQGRISQNPDGTFPIYRYIKNLTDDEIGIAYTTAAAAPTGITATNATAAGNDGVISGLDAAKLYEYKLGGQDAYIPVAAGTTQITGLVPGTYYVRFQAEANGVASMDAVCTVGCNVIVYLDATAGSDSNAGTTETTALATIEAAYDKLADAIGTAGASSTGTIVLVTDYTLTDDVRINLPSHSFPVTLTGKTQAVKLIYQPTNDTESKRVLAFNGPTTLDNITFHAASTSKYDYICATGHPFLVTASVKTTSARSTFPYLVPGDYNKVVANPHMEVYGGQWQSVYISGFKAGHTGTSTVIIDGNTAILKSGIRNTYSGGSTGDYDVTLTKLDGEVFLGCFVSGDMTGNITLRLKEGVTGTIYTGARKGGNVTGTVTIVADGVDLEEVVLVNGPAADHTTGTVAKGVICYASGDATPVEGFDETHIVTGTKVNLVSNLAVHRIAGGGVVELNGYKLTGEGIYNVSAGIKSVSLRPSVAGLYYTGDFTVADELEAAYGIALSTQDPNPVAQDGTTSLYTKDETSVLVQNILKPGSPDNGANAKTKIYARAYVKLADGTIVYGKTVAVNLYQVVKAIDNKWAALDSLQQQGMQQLYAAYSDLLSGWKLTNIK